MVDQSTVDQFDQYIFSGSLPENASTYVTRSADDELYAGLKQGKFCYVLNSRQSGKSSLRVRTMQRLREDGVECAFIDLSAGGIQNVSAEQWYADLSDTLIESFNLHIDIDLDDWWSPNHELTLIRRFRKFIERILLAQIQEDIIIFIDEIDSVLSLEFPTDDFFAFIRACYNQRVDNSAYKRLTFCLLGVASPGNLIQDKQRTPFNIGKAISLKGFQLNEVKPLIRGLQGKFSEPQALTQEILDWTGGQPFLTQKLCQFMVEESEQENPRTVEEVVKSRIIENWESQDEPEHLRTIRLRIFRNKKRARYLLELYQKIQRTEAEHEITADNTIEQSELLLSGLVAIREGKLRVYNRVYQEVFNQIWVENELNNLHPYSENFKFWVASGCKDESRLLRGNALADAEKWAKDKNLSYQDKQFLAASREKEIQEKIAAEEQVARFERERKDREAAEKRNQVLSEANKKANRRIRSGTVVLVLALLGAVSLGVFATIQGNKALEAQRKVEEERKKVTVLQQQTQQVTKKAEQESKKVKALQQKAEQSRKKAEAEQRKAQESENNANDAKRKATEAREQAQKAQKNADNASQEAIKAGKQAKAEQAKAEKAKKSADDANRTAQAAKKEAKNLQNQLASERKNIETVQALSKLAGELRNENRTNASDEALRQAGLSFRVDDHHLKQAMLLASIAQAYQNLKQPKDAQSNFDESLKYLTKKGNISSAQGFQIKAIVKGIQGDLTKQKNKSEAIAAYQEAFNILKNHPSKTDPFKDDQIITAENIESVHRGLLNLKPNRDKQVWNSLKEHYYAKLANSLEKKNWLQADLTTDRLLLFIADREEQGFLDIPDTEKFSCPDLKRMDVIWVQNSDEHFGFSVQKEIWIKTGNRLGVRPENWNRNDEQNNLGFVSAIGWYQGKNDNRASRLEFIESIVKNPRIVGGLPFPSGGLVRPPLEKIEELPRLRRAFFSRAAVCGL